MVDFGSCMHALNDRVRYWLGAMCAWVKREDGKVESGKQWEGSNTRSNTRIPGRPSTPILSNFPLLF
jgi:hypothetical protein